MYLQANKIQSVASQIIRLNKINSVFFLESVHGNIDPFP